MVDSLITKKCSEGESVRFVQVAANLAIDFGFNLPSGIINREMDMEAILAHIAESFGYPLTCHPGKPTSTLYSGSWDGKTVSHIRAAPEDGPVCVCGSFRPEEEYCELVWAFNLNKYLRWRANKSAKTNPTL